MFMSKNKKLIVIGLVIILIALGSFYGGFRLGTVKVKNVSPPTINENNFQANLSLFWEVVKLVKSKFFGIAGINDQDLLYGAVKGVVQSLNDPYSAFYNPSDAKKLNEDLTGSFGGIGAEIGIRNGQLMIVAPLKGNPAEAAGLLAGDKILKIDDKLTNDLTLDEAVKLIRGEVGTEVALLILRDSWEEPKEFKITRAVIRVPTLDWEILNIDNASNKLRVVHIKLYNFNASAPELFYQAALTALLKGIDGIVLDLRNNPGGFLEVGNNIASWFLERGQVIVRERFSANNFRDFRAGGNSALKDLPVVVLVNGGSASASEIVAGAMRDNRHVKIIGEKTFGKGTVQEVETLADGSSLKVSIAEWLTPAGHEINKKGIEPDFEVKMNEEDIKAGRDPQLAKALEILKNEIKARNSAQMPKPHAVN
jgi:carboxyl-terminal processing protease